MKTREYRAKRKDDGKWVFGSLVETTGGTFIYEAETDSRTEVDPETIGQNTGFKDRGGKTLFEGDIVRISSHYPDYPPSEGCRIVGYNAESAAYFFYEPLTDYDPAELGEEWDEIGAYLGSNDDLRIEGNIYDTPDFFCPPESEEDSWLDAWYQKGDDLYKEALEEKLTM